MALRLRRGLSTQLTTITPTEGELIYTTDTKRLYVGDGVTAGGTYSGLQGPSGVSGPSGPSGPNGAASTVSGPQGPSGPNGAASTVSGPSGPSGPIGPSGAGVSGSISSTFSISNSTSSTSSTTGALVVTGGTGIGGNLYVGGTLQPTITVLQVAQDLVINVTANTATTTLDLSLGNTFYVTMAANTTFAFSNVPTGTNLTNFSIITYNSAGGFAISWPASVTWAGAQTPTRTTTSGKSDVYTFFTLNAGTTIIGSLSILGY